MQPKDGKLPGFHSSSVRFQMLSNFANLIKTNQFKIRSKRVCAELETWVWKNGRQDHMDGFHDDTITCLAMGLFVMQFSMARQIQAKEKDNTIMRALIAANSRIRFNENAGKTGSSSKVPMPMYFNREKMGATQSDTYKACMWLFSKPKR